MNYIREINAFYDWLETNSISDSAIGLWHALMHINNKSGWVTEFAVALSTLETKTGLKKDAIIRARLRLQQANRIDFKSRSGQLSAVYRIFFFDVSDVLNDTKCDTNRNANRAQTATLTAHKPQLLNKLEKTKKETPISPTLFDTFWNAYPKKLSKAAAKKAWDKIKPDEQLLVTMMATIERAKTSENWTKENGQYIPYPATWLNGERWKDEYPEKKSNSITDWVPGIPVS